MTRRVSRDIYRVAEVGGITQGRTSERIHGARALGIRHRPRLSIWTHPAWLLVLAVGTIVIAAWWRS